MDSYLKEVANPDQNVFTVVKCGADENSKKTGCVKCDTNYSYFNVKTLECVACKQFDKEKKICYDNMTYLTNTTKTELMLGASKGDVDNYIKTQDTRFKETPDLYLRCPGEKPYSVKGVCQACEKYFNVSSGACATCDFFDPNTKTCGPAVVPKSYISNLKYGVPPYYTKNTTQFLEEYDKAVKAGASVCPFTTPFFNGVECVVCPKTDQYFNLDLKKC